VLSLSLSPHDPVVTAGPAPHRDADETAPGAEVKSWLSNDTVGAFLDEYNAATGGSRVDDDGQTRWHADPMRRFQDRYSDWATDQASSGCEVTTDSLLPPLHPTAVAFRTDSPIRWRAAPVPATESTAPGEVGSPISWRAAPLPKTGSAACPSDDQASRAANGMATSRATPETTAPNALADSSADATETKRDWLIFYGMFAVLVVADVIAACLFGQ
jgi:hypothetical protein